VLAAGAGGQQPGFVTLQVAPRGPGTVTASPAGVGDANPCTGQAFENDCEWRYQRGDTVELRATPDAGDNSFSSWSDPECGSSASCTVRLDDDVTSLVAVFSPLTLRVNFSTNDTGATVAFDPAGQPCEPPDPNNPPNPNEPCRKFPPHTRVSLTVKPGSKAFSGWSERDRNYLCEPASSTTCTITVDDHPTWAGVRFEGDTDPSLPTTISVEFKLRKSGNGSGRVTAARIDCGNACTATYGYGRKVTLTADADEGSYFDGWNGVCARTQTTCTFPVGPITSIRAVFARDTTEPSAPGTPEVRNATRTSIAIGWAASTDNRGVTGYRVYLNDAQAGETKETEHTLEGLQCGRSYAIAVDAVDANGNRSQRASTTAQTLPCALAPRLAGVGIRRAGTNRFVVAKLIVNRATTAQLRLLRGRRPVSRARYGVKVGTNVLRLRVPRKLRGGSYRLEITFVNPDGGTLVLWARKNVRLPRP
jgi:Divergent InlB B-repeat domain/Fibronectin type III domain